MQRVKLSDEVIAFVKGHSTSLQVADRTWHYFPFWLKDMGDGTVEVYSFEKLPEQVKSAIEAFREHGFK